MAKKAQTKAGGGTPATDALSAAGVSFHVHAYEHDPRAGSYGMEAAEALGRPPGQVFKTLLVDVASTGRPDLAVGIVPVDRQLDLKAVATALGAKRAVMADPVAAQRSTGYVLGGISPIGQRTALPTVVDESAILHETVLVSGGRRGLDVELAPDDLVRLTHGTYAPIAR